MPRFDVEYDEKDIIELIVQDLKRKIPGVDWDNNDVNIRVKSKQNYRAQEWENGQLKAVINTRKGG